jgi:hypothetical protein
MWQPGRSFLHLDSGIPDLEQWWCECWVWVCCGPNSSLPLMKWHTVLLHVQEGKKKQIKLSRMENWYYNILITRAASRSSETEDHLDATFTQIFPSLNEAVRSCLGVLGHARVILYLKGMNVTWKLECVWFVLWLGSYTLFSRLIKWYTELLHIQGKKYNMIEIPSIQPYSALDVSRSI